MRRSRFKDSFFGFLGTIGVTTAYARRLEIERRLNLLLTGGAGVESHPLNKDSRRIKVIWVRDAADAYTLFRVLCGGSKVRYVQREGAARYVAEGLVLETFPESDGKPYLSRLLPWADCRTEGVEEVRFVMRK